MARIPNQFHWFSCVFILSKGHRALFAASLDRRGAQVLVAELSSQQANAMHCQKGRHLSVLSVSWDSKADT